MSVKNTALDAFTDLIARACKGLVPPTGRPPPDTRGRWRPYSEKLNELCAHVLEHGGRFVHGLPFTAADMRRDGERYKTLCGAEDVLLQALQDVRAGREEVKHTILQRTEQVLATLACQEQDPRTAEADRVALRTLAAPARGLIQQSIGMQTAKSRTTRARNAALRDAVDRLATDPTVLRSDRSLPPPAPRTSRRRSK
ncbi:MAG: hypothetical protein RMK29_15745 [Myxococcales bacterium]|nr:hypothetical protein [Myxococcota bacterium]MDW8283169.1 hypothetical protein [Myxococcales bacterium]